MARAKRTDRAEARRQYRQRQLEAAAGGDEAASTPAPARSAPARSGPKTQPRPGVLGAIRLAAAPADVRSDLRGLPDLAIRSKAIWLPALLVVISGGALLVPGMGENAIVLLAFQAFVYPPPMAASFLAGLLAPTSAWLAGGITGIVSALTFSVVALVYTIPTSTTAATVPDQRGSLVLFALVVSPTMGLLIGAFAGFYRRFLRLASPQPSRSNDRRKSSNRR